MQLSGPYEATLRGLRYKLYNHGDWCNTQSIMEIDLAFNGEHYTLGLDNEGNLIQTPAVALLVYCDILPSEVDDVSEGDNISVPVYSAEDDKIVIAKQKIIAEAQKRTVNDMRHQWAVLG